MKILIPIISACLSFTLMACNANTTNQAAIDSTAIQTEMSSKQAVLLDVRTSSEYAAGHVAGAILAPYDSIAQTIPQIAPNKQQKIYVYCQSGRRATIAADTLKSMGYTQVVNLGGLNDLPKYGLSVEPPK